MLKKLVILIGISSLLVACQEEELPSIYPCLDGNCNSYFKIDPWVSPELYQDKNEYWHIKFWGPRYFTIVGQLDELHPKYVINNIPLIETQYDSDYWIIFNEIRYKMPIYSVLSWFSDGEYKKPIPIGNLEYTLTDIAKIQPPLNIAGYQIQKNFCWECPYAESALGTYSKYTYNPRQQFFLDKDMIGDTLKIMIKTTFNTDIGEQVIIEKQFKIVIDK